VALPLVRRLPDGSYLALIFAPHTTVKRKAALLVAARAGERVDEDRARLVRAVEYTVPDCGGPDGELICVITTILEPAELSAAEARSPTTSGGSTNPAWMRSRPTCAAGRDSPLSEP